jgi:hypothetical protein
MKKNIHTKLHKKNVRKVSPKTGLKRFYKKLPLHENDCLALTKYFLRHQLLLQLWMDF